MFDINKCKQSIIDMVEGVVPDTEKDDEQQLIKKLIEKIIITTNIKGSRFDRLGRILEGLVAGYVIKEFVDTDTGYVVTGVSDFNKVTKSLPPGLSINKIREGYEVFWNIKEDIDAYGESGVDEDEGGSDTKYVELEQVADSKYNTWWEKEGNGENKTYSSYFEFLSDYEKKLVGYVDFVREVSKQSLYEYFDGQYSIGYPGLIELFKELGTTEGLEVVTVIEKAKQLYDDVLNEVEKQGKETVQAEDILIMYEDDFEQLKQQYLQYEAQLKQQVTDFLIDMKGIDNE